MFGGHRDAKSKMATKNNMYILVSNNNDACKAFNCIVVLYYNAIESLAGIYMTESCKQNTVIVFSLHDIKPV